MKYALPILLLAISHGGFCGLTKAQESRDDGGSTKEVSEQLVFKTDWRGERIELPPEFAPDMGWNGIEEIRFAPGMFDPKSDSFFTYVFVFSLPGDQKLTQEAVKKETLIYYRGLAKSVLKSKGKEVDASKFTFALEKAKAASGTPATVKAPADVTQYSGKLDWVEPFATAEPQILHFEIQQWRDAKTKRDYLFVCTSPRAIADADAIWKELRKVRSDFEVKVVPVE